MQTTAISVVSRTEDLSHLEYIQQYIEEDLEGFYCVDMTTTIEAKVGDYKDCIVARDGPILLTKEPLIPLPECIQHVLSSSVFHLICILVIAVGLPVYIATFWVSRQYRTLAFCIGSVLQIVVYGLNVAMYRGKILKEVAKGFEFWYLLGVQSVSCTCGAYIYADSGTHVAAVVVLMFLYNLTQGLFAYGIDASPWSSKVRIAFMVFFFFSYLALFFATRFVDSLFDEDVWFNYVHTRVNLYVFDISPQEAMLSSLVTLILFYAKYAFTIWMGDEFLLLQLEAKNAQQEIGEILEASEGLTSVRASVKGNSFFRRPESALGRLTSGLTSGITVDLNGGDMSEVQSRDGSVSSGHNPSEDAEGEEEEDDTTNYFSRNFTNTMIVESYCSSDSSIGVATPNGARSGSTRNLHRVASNRTKASRLHTSSGDGDVTRKPAFNNNNTNTNNKGSVGDADVFITSVGSTPSKDSASRNSSRPHSPTARTSKKDD